jgi:hypothetical protein
MYLGDGYIARLKEHQFVLRIYLNRKQRDVIERVRAAIENVLPGARVNYVQRREFAVTVVSCYSRAWPEIFPQHGRGRKHTRSIQLAGWQEEIVRECPAKFLRGLLESDGCRHRRIVRGRHLDTLFGLSAEQLAADDYASSAIPSSERNTSTPGA